MFQKQSALNMKRYILFSLTCIAFLCVLSLAEENTKLLFVQMVYRHGDRAPITLYPNDPNPESVWPGGLAALSLLGRKQHYALGRHFRSMYKNLTSFTPMEIDVVSSFVDRCVMSAETNLASFFAPESNWSFEDNVHWQPIPIRYLAKNIDKYLETESDCPRAEEELERVFNSPGGQQFTAEHREMMQNLSILSGKDISNWTEASYFHDVIFIEKKYNLSTPSWVEPYWEELTNVSNLSFFWSFNSPLLHRLRAGPLLQRIIDNMNKKIAGDLKDLKFQIFSAHDTTLSVVLVALDLFNNIAPPYASSLLFELHEMPDGQNAMRLLYFNSSAPETHIDPPHILVLHGCTEYCPLEYVVNYTRDMMPGDWDQECRLDKSLVEKIAEKQNPHILFLHGCTEYCPLEYVVNYTRDMMPGDWDQECQLDKSLVDKIAQKQVTVGWFFVFVAVVVVALSVYTIWRIHSRRQDKKKGVSPVNYNSLDAS